LRDLILGFGDLRLDFNDSNDDLGDSSMPLELEADVSVGGGEERADLVEFLFPECVIADLTNFNFPEYKGNLFICF
jgi:hypothetical protein